MSTGSLGDDMYAAIMSGEVRAVDEVLQRGVLPSADFVEEDADGGWKRHTSLLYLAVQVPSLECICIDLPRSHRFSLP